MITSSSDTQSLVTKCHYHQEGGIFCSSGFLYQWRKPDFSVDRDGVIAEPCKLEGQLVQCPACEGKSVILTQRGREMLTFLEVFARPFLRDLVDELFEEREQR